MTLMTNKAKQEITKKQQTLLLSSTWQPLFYTLYSLRSLSFMRSLQMLCLTVSTILLQSRYVISTIINDTLML